jgi:hypothetical protein
MAVLFTDFDLAMSAPAGAEGRFFKEKAPQKPFWRFAVLAVEIAKSFWGFPLACERKIRPSHTARKGKRVFLFRPYGLGYLRIPCGDSQAPQ